MGISTQQRRDAIRPLQFDCARRRGSFARSISKAEGLLVLEAEDGLDALEQARCERPDLVLTDMTMPGLDGFQLTLAAFVAHEVVVARAGPSERIAAVAS